MAAVSQEDTAEVEVIVEVEVPLAGVAQVGSYYCDYQYYPLDLIRCCSS